MRKKQIPVEPITGNAPVNQGARAWATGVAALGVLLDLLKSASPDIVREFPTASVWLPKAVLLLGLVWLIIQRTQEASIQKKG